MERLRHFRDGFYAQDPPLGLEHQSADPAFADYRENMRWTMGRVLFVTLHVVGSNNNFGRTAEADAEYRSRSSADTHWLRESFAQARERDLLGVALAIHADPRFERSPRAHARTGLSRHLRQAGLASPRGRGRARAPARSPDARDRERAAAWQLHSSRGLRLTDSGLGEGDRGSQVYRAVPYHTTALRRAAQ